MKIFMHNYIPYINIMSLSICGLHINESPELKNIDDLFAGYVYVQFFNHFLDACSHGNEFSASTLPQLTIISQCREVDRATEVDCKNMKQLDYRLQHCVCMWYT